MSSLDSLRHSSPDFSIEKSFLTEKCRLIAGVDEAGRGALAGPLSVAMVIYDPSIFSKIPHEIKSTIADSKQLTAKKRAQAMDIIRQSALAYTRVFIPHTIIDSCGINVATELAVKRMLAKINVKPHIILMDGNFRFNFDIPFHAVVKGDCRSVTIASASIIAKVARDSQMCRLDSVFPGYGFARHKGYGTKSHIEALCSQGLCAIHRRSYDPARSMLEAQGLMSS